MTDRSKKYLLIVFFFIPLLLGCPYESEISIGDKESAIAKEEIIGVWLSTRQPQQNRSVITLGKNNIYRIKHYREVNAKVEVSDFEAFITPIDGKFFVNVYEPSKRYTSGGYLLFQLEILDSNKIKITEIDKYKVPTDIQSRNELIQYIKEGIANGSLYANSETWVRE